MSCHGSISSSCSVNSLYSRFNACRFPVKPSDTARKFDPSTHNHIVFVRKNKFFEVPLFHEGKELSLPELEVCVASPRCEHLQSTERFGEFAKVVKYERFCCKQVKREDQRLVL